MKTSKITSFIYYSEKIGPALSATLKQKSTTSIKASKMSVVSGGGKGSLAEMKSVAVAVNAENVSGGGSGSRRAVLWAVENLMNTADRFILVHVMPPIISVPTLCNYLKHSIF